MGLTVIKTDYGDQQNEDTMNLIQTDTVQRIAGIHVPQKHDSDNWNIN